MKFWIISVTKSEPLSLPMDISGDNFLEKCPTDLRGSLCQSHWCWGAWLLESQHVLGYFGGPGQEVAPGWLGLGLRRACQFFGFFNWKASDCEGTEAKCGDSP